MVAVILAVTVSAAILAPIVGRLTGGVATLPESVIAGLADLLKVLAGGVIVYLGDRGTA